jgi:hypothetical protein
MKTTFLSILILSASFLSTKTLAQIVPGGSSDRDLTEVDSSSVETSRALYTSLNKVELKNYTSTDITSNSAKYVLQQDGKVLVEFYNLNGQKIATVINENKKAGAYTSRFNFPGLSNTMYVCRLTVISGNRHTSLARKMFITN